VAEKALTAVIQEAYIQGVSTRSVDLLVQAMGLEPRSGSSGISKSQVSRLCGEIDGRVETFLTRPLEGDWPYVWLDATYIKVREAGRSSPRPSPSRWASTATDGARCSAWTSAAPKPRFFGPRLGASAPADQTRTGLSSSANWPTADCAV
jgi:hypothetical protein